jgi:hypothetical protein
MFCLSAAANLKIRPFQYSISSAARNVSWSIWCSCWLLLKIKESIRSCSGPPFVQIYFASLRGSVMPFMSKMHKIWLDVLLLLSKISEWRLRCFGSPSFQNEFASRPWFLFLPLCQHQYLISIYLVASADQRFQEDGGCSVSSFF